MSLLERHDQTGERRSILVLSPGFLKAFEPPSIHNDVIIEICDPVALCFQPGSISCKIKSGTLLNNIANARELSGNRSRAPSRGALSTTRISMPWWSRIVSSERRQR